MHGRGVWGLSVVEGPRLVHLFTEKQRQGWQSTPAAAPQMEEVSLGARVRGIAGLRHQHAKRAIEDGGSFD